MLDGGRVLRVDEAEQRPFHVQISVGSDPALAQIAVLAHEADLAGLVGVTLAPHDESHLLAASGHPACLCREACAALSRLVLVDSKILRDYQLQGEGLDLLKGDLILVVFGVDPSVLHMGRCPDAARCSLGTDEKEWEGSEH